MKPGDILASKYRLVQRIGEGAMGEVWAGENQATGGKVALKFIIPSAPEYRTPDLRQRLLREARACGKLAHRNIVQIYDAGETPEGDPYLVLELLRGKTLAERLKDTRRIDVPMALRVGAEIADALAIAHAAKIIHRDLKPANIFLHREEGVPDERFIVKVLDFGVSKSVDGSSEGPATNTNVTVGSPAYMSPEQVAMRKDLDGRTDIWSLGVVLYEMLTGGRPFTGNVDEVVRQVVLTKENPVPPPSIRIRNIPPELDEIVGRCLDFDRDRRFANAADLSVALNAVAETVKSIRGRLSSSNMFVTNAGERGDSNPNIVAGSPNFARMPITDEPSQGGGTQPMPGRGLRESNLALGAPLPSAKSATGTDVLSPNAPVASPAPAWRKEMEQWRAQRASSAGTVPLSGQEAANGSTQAIEIADAPKSANEKRTEPTTTTSIGAMSQPDFVLPKMGNPAADSASKPKPKRSSRHFFIMMGMGILSAIAVVLLMMNASRMDHEGTVGREQVDNPAMSADVPIAPVSVATLPPSAPAPKVEEAKSVVVEPPVVLSAAVPTASVAEVVPSARELATADIAPTVTAPPTAPRSTTKGASPSVARVSAEKSPEPVVKGFVNVTCNPSCDEVFIDGRSFGPSPVVRAEVPVGPRSVRGRRRNQPDARTQVNVEEKRTASATIN